MASFAEKIVRKAARCPDPIRQLTDLCGARLIAGTGEELSAFNEAVRTHFAVLEGADTSARLGTAELGYRSVHFVMALRPDADYSGIDRAELEAAGLFARFDAEEAVHGWFGPRHRAEIQVRTLAQHVRRR